MDGQDTGGIFCRAVAAFGGLPSMMLDWHTYREQLLATIGDLAKLSPGTLRGYRELGDAGSKKNVLGGKTRELIALAVAVTRQCDGCITVHTDAARKHGATSEEIAEALGVAIAVNAGAALVYSARVMDAYGAVTRRHNRDLVTHFGACGLINR